VEQHSTTAPLLVVQTYVVHGPDRTRLYYEIQLAPDPAPDAPRLVLITCSAALYAQALDLETRATRVHVEWHLVQTRRGAALVSRRMLDALTVAA